MPTGIFLPEAEKFAVSDPALHEVFQKLIRQLIPQAAAINRGNNSPQNSVNAVPGTLYIQNGTSEAALWIKGAQSGPGAQGWIKLISAPAAKQFSSTPSNLGPNIRQLDGGGTPRQLFQIKNNTLDDVGDGTSFKRLANVNADNTLHASTSINNQGSLLTVANYGNSFSYTSTANSIAWSWSAFTIYRVDGSTIAVAASAAAINFTALVASTTYFFGVYYNPTTGTMNIVISDISSGAAKESNAQIIQTINADGRIPIAVNMTATTAATGGTGGGTGGAGAGCPAAEQLLDTLEQGFVAARELKPGMHLRASGDLYEEVVRTEKLRALIVRVCLAGDDLRVEENHLWQLWSAPGAPTQWITTRNLTLDSPLMGADGCTLFADCIARDGVGDYVRITVRGNVFRIGRSLGHNAIT